MMLSAVCMGALVFAGTRPAPQNYVKGLCQFRTVW